MRQSTPESQRDSAQFSAKIISSISQVESALWDSFVGETGSPFLLHDWLRCLEESNSASSSNGWIPQHILLYNNSTLLGAVPLYIKTHSMGEFIFDQSWAEISYSAGIRYYPKVLVGVPFTPASGSRLLVNPICTENDTQFPRNVVLKALVKTLQQFVIDMKLSSIHVNFIEIQDEIDALINEGFHIRTSVQYHFQNDVFNGETEGKTEGFEKYLSLFRAKKRTKIKRERKSVYVDQNLTLKVVRGAEIDKNLFDHMYYIYKSTIDKMFYGNQYLTREFFRLLSESSEQFRENLCFILAFKKGEEHEPIAGTFNVIRNGRFYGRYWGSLGGIEYPNLHFETCYYKSIEYVIEHGLKSMEPGAGGGDFKFMRGFEPVEIYSAHWSVNPSLDRYIKAFCMQESVQIQNAIDSLTQVSAIRQKAQQ